MQFDLAGAVVLSTPVVIADPYLNSMPLTSSLVAGDGGLLPSLPLRLFQLGEALLKIMNNDIEIPGNWRRG